MPVARDNPRATIGAILVQRDAKYCSFSEKHASGIVKILESISLTCAKKKI